MNTKLKTGLISGAALLFFSGASLAAITSLAPSPESKKAIEVTIKDCETKYTKVKTKRAELHKGVDEKMKQIKKPSTLSLPATKKKYADAINELNLIKKAFDINFNQFTEFTNEKIKVRIAQTNQQMIEKNNEYSSNCGRFADGLNGYVTWALTGKAPKGYEIIYKDWIAEARKAK